MSMSEDTLDELYVEDVDDDEEDEGGETSNRKESELMDFEIPSHPHECKCEDCECDDCEDDDDIPEVVDLMMDDEPDIPAEEQKDNKQTAADQEEQNRISFTFGGNDDEDDIKTIFMDEVMDEETEVEDLTSIEGLVGITLSDKTKTYFGIENLTPESSIKNAWLNWKKIRLHLFTFEEESEFLPHYDKIKYYPDLAMLLGVDTNKQTGHEYFLCLSLEARNRVLHPPKKKRIFVDKKKKEEDQWNDLAAIYPRKWRGLGSEVEVDEERVIPTRPPITVTVSRLRTLFGEDCNFADSENPEMFINIESKDPSEIPFIHRIEIDRGTQAKLPSVTTSTQTGTAFKRNKMVQQSIQSISEENVEIIMKSKSMAKFFKGAMPRLEKVLQQNEMVDLLFDDYTHLKAKRGGHEMEFSTESLLLQEYQTYSDSRHTKGRTVNWLRFHPALEDIVIMALGEDVTFDKRIESHSKVLMEPNFVLFWDIKDSSHPQLMLDAPNDVFTFMVNPSDPHLVCGGCANGQVALWDLGRTFYEMRANAQDRSRKKSATESDINTPTFLDRLKDSTEKYICPLISPAALSNLDASHKKPVTSTAWLPAHVELGKTGAMFENSANHSVQFFSLAGDGTLRLWDTRPPKPGVDDYDNAGNEDEGNNQRRDVIKVNPWAHLENNQWKFILKLNLSDGNGPMYSTLLSLTELRRASPGDSYKFSTMDSNESVEGIKRSTKLSTELEGDELQNEGENEEDLEDEGEEEEEEEIAPVEEETMQSAKKQDFLNPLENGQTTLFMGSETGQIAFMDWMQSKEGTVNNEFGTKVCQNIYMEVYHDGAITSISRSPRYHDLMLVIGGGTITIWKEKSRHPILQCCGSDNFYWCATWSNSRPGVFYVGTREGSIAVWDLLDRSNGPVMTQQVSNSRITGVALPKAASASKKQFIATTDSDGVLFVLVLPRYYARPLPNEDSFMKELMGREDTRQETWDEEAAIRNKKLAAVRNKWVQSRIVKSQEQQDTDEIAQEKRLNAEYLEFLKYQAAVVEVLKQDEPTLPTEEDDMEDEFAALILAAQQQQAMEDAAEALLLAEEEEEEDEEEEETEITK